MDPLTALVDGPRARGAFALRAILAAPWGIEVRDRAPLTVVVVTRGRAHLEPAGGDPVELGPGELALVRGPAPYRVLDAAGSPIDVVILPGQRCVRPDGAPATEWHGGPGNAWGNDPAGETTMLIGTYHDDGEVGRRLLEAIPPVLAMRADECAAEPLRGTLLPLLAAELAAEQPAGRVVLDRLLDVLVIATVRTWAARTDVPRLPWVNAADPAIRATLRRLHAEPGRECSVATLAAEAGLSRATFARRFSDAVGESPIAYLTRTRLDLAADLLRDSDVPVATVGQRVGYANPFVFSAAFKRRFGRSPQHYRRGSSTEAGVGRNDTIRHLGEPRDPGASPG